MSPNSAELMKNAGRAGLAIPAFNIPYLPMMAPVIQAMIDEDAFGLIETARPEWYKFEARSAAAIAEEFAKYENPDFVRLHLDHVPVIDEDNLEVDYLPVIRDAIDLGYQSVMIDGSRLDLDANIAATRQVAELAHQAGIPCEAELGSVLGHEDGPPLPYEEIFASGRGFTDVEEARRFVQESGCDWLSVAVGSVHGAISGVMKDQKKVEARLNIEHLQAIRDATDVPLVLHGGSGVQRPYLLEAIRHGMTKVNIGTEIRQAYEQSYRQSEDVGEAQEATYERTRWLLRDYFNLTGTRDQVFGAAKVAERLPGK
ncbi:MAG: class II fructose-bisphosphate aldolase [Chloroflexota bacterium]|nr:class II fructose-bisphosphate aldolase [Chloroflexota bacterium]